MVRPLTKYKLCTSGRIFALLITLDLPTFDEGLGSKRQSHLYYGLGFFLRYSPTSQFTK